MSFYASVFSVRFKSRFYEFLYGFSGQLQLSPHFSALITLWIKTKILGVYFIWLMIFKLDIRRFTHIRRRQADCYQYKDINPVAQKKYIIFKNVKDSVYTSPQRCGQHQNTYFHVLFTL